MLLFPKQIPYLLLGILGIVHGHYREFWKKIPKDILIALLIFWFWGLLSTLWSIDTKASLTVSLKLVPLMLLGFGWISFCREPQDPAKLLKPVIISQVAVAVFILADWVAGRPFLGWWHVNSVSAFGNVSATMALTLFPVLFWLKHTGQKKYAIAFGALLLTAFTTLDFDIIPVMVIMAGSISLILYQLPFAKRVSQIVLIGGLLFSPLIAIYLFSPNNILLFNQVFPVLSYLHRLHIWHYLGQQIPHIPWLGQGLNTSGLYLKTSPETYHWTFIEKTGEISTVTHSWSTYPLFYHPHNWFLQLWYELHITGVVLFGLLLWILLHHLYTLPKAYRTTALSYFIIVIFFSLVTVDFFYTWWISTILLTSGILLMIIKNTTPLNKRGASYA